MLKTHLRNGIAALALTTVLAACSTEDQASTSITTSNQNQPVPARVELKTDAKNQESMAMSGAEGAAKDRNLPALVVTNDPPPDVLYHRGSRDTVLMTKQAEAAVATKPALEVSHHVETLVTRKVASLAGDIQQLGHSIEEYQDNLHVLQGKNDALASDYYALVASMNTELQAGTTAGNPVLTNKWNAAQDKLNNLADTSGNLNTLFNDVSAEASKAAYLQENVRSTYGLSGAVEDDHKKLQVLEDSINQDIVEINRLLTAVGDEITRRNAYLRAERLNLQTLSLSISNGELYGQNMTNSLFKKAAEDGQDIFKAGKAAPSAPAQKKPLVIIRFDRANINYQQPLYTAVSQALEKYPSANFELVAVSTTEGNPAQVALATTEARKNGEGVLRALTQMGVPMERISLNAANSKDVTNSEVQLFVR